METDTSLLVENEQDKFHFVQLPNSAARDARLSWGARGLYAFLRGLPAGWSANRADLLDRAPEGRAALQRLIKELSRVGALVITPKRINEDDARRMNEAAVDAGGDKKYRRGQVTGQKWVVRSAGNWAVELPLSKKTVMPVSCPTVFLPDGKPADKKTVIKEAALYARAEKRCSLVILENDEDRVVNEGLVAEFGQVAVEAAAKKVMAGGCRPYLSNIQKILKPIPISAITKKGATRGHDDTLNTHADAASAARGTVALGFYSPFVDGEGVTVDGDARRC